MLEIHPEDLPYTQHLTPYGRMELFFYLTLPSHESPTLETDLKIGEGSFTGFYNHSMQVEYNRPFRAVGISFQPWASAWLFNIPAQQFSNRSTSYSEINPSCSLGERLLLTQSDEEVVLCFEHFLMNQISGTAPDEIGQFISQEMMKKGTNSSTQKTLTSKIGLSKRRIEQRFLASVGVTMGTFSQISRFDRALGLMVHPQKNSLTQVGLDAGYYDQAHFIRDFKRLAGLTPSQYLKGISQMNKSELDFNIL